MYRFTTTTPSNKRVFGACLLSFAILITPIAALAAPRTTAGPTVKKILVPPSTTATSATEVFLDPPTLPAPPPVVATVTASMVDSIENDDADSKIDPTNGNPVTTERIRYTATISNSGTDATGLKFTDTLDSHTTLVGSSLDISPLAGNDTYSTIGNTLLEVGPLAAPSTSPKITFTGSVFDNDTEFLSDSFTLKSLQAVNFVSGTVTATSTNGGTVVMEGNGRFSYLPPAGNVTADTFTYTITDDGTDGIAGNADDLTNTGTVTINFSGNVWYVKNNQAAGGLGRSTDPFDTLLEAQTASIAGDTIYVFNGNNTTSGQNVGITLKANQRFVGEGVQLDVPVTVNGGPNPTVLRAAGTAPLVTNTAGNTVTVTNIAGVSIRGFNFTNGGAAGNTNAIAATFSTAGGGVTINTNTIAGGTDVGENAIDITTTTTTPGGCTATITNNTIASAGGEGIDINGQGSSGIVLDLQSNAVTSTGNGIDISGVGGGTLNISAFANNSISGASGANGIIINTARFDSVPGGGVDAITAGTTAIGSAGAGNGVGGNGLVLINTTGTLPFIDLDIWADGGNALDVTGLGAATSGIIIGANVGTINATAGTAVKVSGATIDLQLTSISSNNATTGGVSLGVGSGVNGTFSAGASSTITNATGDDFIVGSGTANITYNGPLSSSNGNSIDVSGHTGGTIAFTGSVNDTGSGISLTSNGGTIINFSGGIVLNGTAAVFTATGGGTVTVTGINTIGTPTAATTTALNVTDTIGASGLTFRSISSNGAASGIILNGTGAGFLTVTGTGGSCTTAGSCTGGAIQNSTQDAVKLTSANNISLSDMFLFSSAQSNVDATTVTGLTLVRIYSDLSTDDGILGNGVTNLTITNGTYDRGGAGSVPCNVNGVEITNLLGTSTVTGALFKRSNTIQFHVVNNTATSFGGTPDQLTVSNTNWNTHTNACAGDHLSVGSDTGGNFRLTVNNTIGANVFKSSGIAVQAASSGTNGKMDALISNITSGGNTAGAGNADTNTAGVVLGQTGTGTLTFNVHDNTTLGTGSVGIKLTHASAGGTSSGRIENNSITHIAGAGTDAMGLDLQGVGAVGGTSTIVVKNNTITGNFQRGIKVQCGQGNPQFNVTLDDNHLTANDTTGNALQVFDVEAGLSGAGSASTMRLNMLNNDVAFGPGALYTASYRLINRAGNTFQLQDFVGNGALTTDVANWVTNAPKSNTTGGGTVSITATAPFSASAGPIPTAFLRVPGFGQPYAPNSANQQEYTAYAGDALRNIVQASIAGESDSSNMSASLAQRFDDVVSLVGRFANSVDSLMVPTTYAAEKTEVGSQKSEVSQPSDVRLNHAKSRRTITTKAAPTTASLAPMFAGETVTFDNGGAGITLPPGKSITITFKATLNDPPNVINNPYPTGGPQVSTQGTVSGTNFSNVLTDDPAPPAPLPNGATDPTVTYADLYNSATDITPNSSPTITEGDPVTYTATVTPNQAGSPTTLSGNVTFFDGVSPIAGCTNVALTGVAPYTASCTTSALTAAGSPHSINAVYNGDGNFDTSTDPAAITQVVIPCNGAPVVTKIADTNDGVCDADCSLREAIAVACAGSTITFNAAGVFSTPQTITLSLGELSVTRNLTIDGPDAAANHVTVNGGGASRVFHIQPGKTDTIRDLTVTGGLASGSFPANSGGGIYNDLATLSLINMTVSGNTATFGGGVYNSGNGGTASLTVTNSTLSGNTATTHGGAIYNDGIGAGTAILALINSTISGNKANGQGGGVLTIGSTASTTVTTTNATITNNTADFDDTSASDNGGGLFVGSGPDVRLRNTIIAGNFRGTTTPIPDDIQGANVNITALSSNNLIGTGGAGGLTAINGNLVGVANPGLGPLANNGGQTQTHNLLFGSPAIEAGSNTFSDAVSLTTDQRGTGFIRKADSADANTTKTVDIGAIEAQVTIEDITDKSTPEDTPLAFSFNVGDDGQILTVAATSSNTGLVSNANAVITGGGSTRTLTLTPTANQFGTTTITVTVTSTVASGSQTMQDTFVLTVTAVGDQPTISSATTPEDTQTTSGLQITKSVNDGAEVAFFKITNITNGLLFKFDGTTPIVNNDVITEAEGNAGLKFTPAANLFSPGTTFSFQAQGAIDAAGNGAGAAGTGTITVNPVADTPSVTNATTNEDVQTANGFLVISRNAADGAEVTHFKITGITGGTLFQNNGTTAINNNDFITFAQGNAGLRFTPAANLFSPSTPFFGFTIQASTSNVDGGLGGNLVNATVTVNPVADTPSVTDATTQLNTQTTSGLVISRNAADGAEVTHFKITNIVNGSLFQNNGTTPIAPGSFITFAEGNAGLKFTPTAGLSSPGNSFSFDIQASVSNADGGLGGSVITAMITVNPSLTMLVNQTTDENDMSIGNGVCDTSASPGDQCTLRAAIQETNFASTADVINFDPLLNGQTIALDGINGPLPVISDAVSINGPGANLLTVQRTAVADFRIFEVTAATPKVVTISGLTIKDGKQSGGGSPTDSGGGILLNSSGTLTLIGSTLTNNNAALGGAINNIGAGTVNVINSALNGNLMSGNGGAIYNGGSGIVNLTNSTLSGNTVVDHGGAIFNGGTATTILTNCTVASNTSVSSGGGIYRAAGTVTLKNTIVAYNTASASPDDVNGAVNADYSLIANTTGASITGANNQLNVDPLLGALANNGGPTQTRSLGLGSPALDTGNNAYVTAPPFINVVPITDQRGTGFPRILDAADADTTQTVDMGAFEARAAVEDITDKSTPVNTPLSFSFNVGDASQITTVTATSANTTLVPNAPANISVTGSGSSRMLNITPAPNEVGTSVITVTVTSGTESMSDTFTLTVTPVADLLVTKTDSPDPVTAGTNITYAISMTNNGPNPAQTVTLTDAVPANTTFVSFIQNTGPSFSCTDPGLGGTGNVSCSLATMASGATATFTMIVNVNANTAEGTTITNNAVGGSATADSNSGNNTGTATTNVIQSDIEITSKTDTPDPVNAGSNITYTVNFKNNSAVNSAANVTVTDAVPAGTTFVSASGPGSWTPTTPAVGGTGNVVFSKALVAGAETATFTIVVKVDTSVTNGTIITNTATTATTSLDTVSANNSGSTTTLVQVNADLQISSKTDTPDPVTASNNITYAISFQNNGPSDGQGVTITDAVPAGTTFVSASITTGSGWTIPSPPAVGGTGNVVFSKTTVLAGESAIFEVVVKVNNNAVEGSVITNNAVAAGTTNDPTPGNNTGTATTTVRQSDIEITSKTDTPDPVTAGQNITYTVNFKNNSAFNTASNVTVTDAVPVGTTLVSAATVSPGWARTDVVPVGGTGNIVFSKALVAASETAVFTIVVKVDANVLSGSTITNTATAATTSIDTNSANNSASATTTVNASADLQITSKTDVPDPVIAGDNITYTINFQNNGPSDAQTVTVTDAVPANTTYVSSAIATGTGWTIPSPPAVGGTGNVVFSKGTVAAGETASFTVVVKVNSNTPAATIISNDAVAASATTDGTPGNNTGNATTAVATSADLSVTKIDTPDPVIVGTNLTYTITVTNNGSSDAQTLSLADAVPANTTLVSFTVPAGWTRTDVVPNGGTGTVTATAPTLAAGANAVFTLVVNVNPGTPHLTVLTNSATVASPTDSTPGNNTGIATTTVNSTLALTVNDSSDAADTNVGDRICDTNAAPGDQCTLRAAIQETKAASTNDTIDFSLPANTTIVLLSALDPINGGDLVMTGPATGVTVSGNNLYRVFNVGAGNVQVLNLTIANGQASGGGGIFNSGNLTITNSTLVGNKAVSGSAKGGAIYSSSGTLTIINSTISGNTAVGGGGGLNNAGTSIATLVNVTITNNRADADGNAAGNGGGIAQTSSNPITLRNTIVAGNFVGLSPGTVADDINGTVDPASNNNLIGTGGAGGLTNGVNNNQVGVVDARLGVLANNGGPTQTHALLSGSVALDAGDDSVTLAPYSLTTDQRGPGFPRKADGPDANTTQTVDIGAFEADPSVEDISDKSTNEDTALPTFVFNVGDAATPFTSITATSSNTTLVPNANIVVGPDTASTRTLSITPAANEFGTTTITVTATKIIGGNPVSFSDTFILTVNGVNDPPSFTKGPDQTVAEDSGAQSVANWATAISQGPGNESGQTLTFLVQNNTNPGLFSAGPAISPTGTLTYTPAANANGTATITIALMDNGGGTDTSASQSFQITVTEVNDAPDAVDDALSSVAEDSGPRTISIASLLANDSKGPANESGQTLTLTAVSNPVGGTVTKDAVNVVFTPTADFNGPASFQYTVTDNGTTNGAADPKTDTATVSFTVTEVNDAPTAVSETIPNLTEDSPQSIPFATLTANDVKGPANESGQTLIVKTVGNPVGGTVSILAGNVVFTPTANYTGPGSFDYTVEDNGTTNGVADPKTSGIATASFTITSVNDAPVAVNDTLTSMAEDAAPRAIPFADLTANDSKGGPDESGQTLTVVSVGNAVGGSVLLVPGFVVFTPNGDYNGPASFTYTVQDNGTTNGAPDPKTSGSALVQFTITEVNDAPSAFNDTLPDVAQNSGERTIAFADLLANDVKGPADESGQTLTILSVGNPVGVTVSIVAGTVRVTPLPDFAGPAGFQYTIRDNGTTSGFGDEKTSVATVSFNVIGQGGGGGVLRFSAANYSVAEGAGFRTITVERTGDSSQAVTVDYASSDHSNPADFIPCSSPGVGFASSRCDFTTAIGTLRFAAGETSKTFNVLISNDNYVEGPETLELTLSNPTGGAVFGVPQTAVLTIQDDLSEPGTNPIDTSSEFVRSQYHDFLNREPDAPGLAFWTDNIELCNDASRKPVGQTIAQCIDKQRESTAVAFFAAPEFQITGGFVYNLYKGSLTGAPNYDGGSPGASPGRFPTSLEFMRDVGQVSEGIVVNNAISGAVVEANRNRLAAEFVQRPEFIIKYGGLNNTLYVDELFNTTGITPTAAEKQALVDGLTGGTETRASVLRKVVDGTVVISESNVQFTTSYGQAFINQENRRKFVFMEYIAYLRRNPDTPGFVFWLGKLNFYNGDPFQAEMVRSFILSPEYRNRFGQP